MNLSIAMMLWRPNHRWLDPLASLDHIWLTVFSGLPQAAFGEIRFKPRRECILCNWLNPSKRGALCAYDAGSIYLPFPGPLPSKLLTLLLPGDTSHPVIRQASVTTPGSLDTTLPLTALTYLW